MYYAYFISAAAEKKLAEEIALKKAQDEARGMRRTYIVSLYSCMEAEFDSICLPNFECITHILFQRRQKRSLLKRLR